MQEILSHPLEPLPTPQGSLTELTSLLSTARQISRITHTWQRGIDANRTVCGHVAVCALSLDSCNTGHVFGPSLTRESCVFPS
jgi:hypothetical protein